MQVSPFGVLRDQAFDQDQRAWRIFVATTPLHERAQEYLRLRRALGFRLRHEGYILPQFADYLEQRAHRLLAVHPARGHPHRRDCPAGQDPLAG